MRSTFLCFSILWLSSASLSFWGQSVQQFTLSGYITDAATGETLIGATVWSEDASVGVVSNLYGFYTLTLPAKTYNLQVAYIGYERQRLEVDLSGENVKFNLAMVPGTKLGEAVVTGENESRIEEQVQMSKMEIPIDQIKSLPAIGGEVDLLKSLQLLPGVQSGGEGTSGLYVRGGSPDQNLMLLDGVPLYSVSPVSYTHLTLPTILLV